ncbi:MAG: thymidine phosphorylase [Eubacteriales bacterium]
MHIIDIIEKKRDGKELTQEEIDFFVKGFTEESIPDYQASALLMAMYIKGLSKDETANLTISMLNSGEKMDLSGIKGVVADKHSTGGVADTTTLVAAPIAAACGVRVAKLSGRALGHTGGTLDKLEAIPNFNVNLSLDEFKKQVNDIGLAIAGQTLKLCPADKKIYALRDVTATVSNVSLIASSIMSKKIASGAPAIVLDVKTGNGAFMKKYEDSLALALEMVDIGTKAGRNVTAFITDMNQPLGRAVGNAFEVKEAIDILEGREKGDLFEVSIALASQMIFLTGNAKNYSEAVLKAKKSIGDKSAINKLKQMISYQGGDTSFIEDLNSFVETKFARDIIAKRDGYIGFIDVPKIGQASISLGSGRRKLNDSIDYKAGIYIEKRLNDKVFKGDVLMRLYSNNEAKFDEACFILKDTVNIQDGPIKKPKLIYKVIDKNGQRDF